MVIWLVLMVELPRKTSATFPPPTEGGRLCGLALWCREGPLIRNLP